MVSWWCQGNIHQVLTGVMIILWWQFAPDPDRCQSDRSTPPPPHSLSSSLASATSPHIITNVMFSIMRWKISLKAWKRILSRISLCHLSFKGENLMKLWFKGESIFVNVSWAKACRGKEKAARIHLLPHLLLLKTPAWELSRSVDCCCCIDWGFLTFAWNRN